jgi:aminoglycoside phosphotransferase (APT) family kinase protein
MDKSYLGTLNYSDPLYEILLSQVFPDVKDPIFHVNRISHHRVFKYTEEKNQIAIVGKFFKLDDIKQERVLRIKGEYDNLHKIRRYGFDKHPNYVVRPISKEESIGLALVEEFIQGKDLDHYLKKAIYRGDRESLKRRLSRLASFLHTLHSKTESGNAVDLNSADIYFVKILHKLRRQNVISGSEVNRYLELVDKWLSKPILTSSKGVIVHGDATPTNFIFTDGGDVVAIDLERMKNADAVFDIGMICGEIKHAFLWRTGNPYESEPFIRHFFKSYASHFPDPQKAFMEITMRNPFYMALTELRIARNEYLGWDYRKKLTHEAMECLRWGLKLR